MTSKNLSIATNTIKNRIEKGDLKPYDEAYSLDHFLKVLRTCPELQESLDHQLKCNPAWVSKADGNEIFFILNDSRWKRPKNLPFEPKVHLNFIGLKQSPTISIYL